MLAPPYAREENGGAGVYSADLRKHYLLEDDDWKYDIMPEILNGKNVADFVDPEIEEKLAELEREEDELERQYHVGGHWLRMIMLLLATSYQTRTLETPPSFLSREFEMCTHADSASNVNVRRAAAAGLVP